MTPETMRHEAIFSSTAPPIRMASVLVSPIEPCTVPRKARIQSMPAPVTASMPPGAERQHGGAGEAVDRGPHRVADICAG